MPSLTATDLVFFEPYATPTEIIMGKMACVGTTLSGNQNPIIYPIIYSINRTKFDFVKVFPPISATSASLSTFMVSASAYDVNFTSLSVPKISYNHGTNTYNLTFFAFNSAGVQYLFNYNMSPTKPLWAVNDAVMYPSKNAPQFVIPPVTYAIQDYVDGTFINNIGDLTIAPTWDGTFKYTINGIIMGSAHSSQLAIQFRDLCNAYLRPGPTWSMEIYSLAGLIWSGENSTPGQALGTYVHSGGFSPLPDSVTLISQLGDLQPGFDTDCLPF